MKLKPITEEEALARIASAGDEDRDDTEMAHLRYDVILCDVLESLGYTKLVAAYNETEKWYG